MRQNDEVRIQILATSDMHSRILDGDVASHIYRAGTYIEKVREQYKNVMLLDNGGSLAGSIVSFYYAVVAPYKRHPMIKLMNAMDYDASGMSANGFKFGLDFLNRSVALARFPWLSANITYAMTKEPYFSTPYLLKTFDGVRIAVVGFTSDALVRNENIEMEPDIAVEHATTAAKRWIRYIHEVAEPDFLIVLYHGDYARERQASDVNTDNQALTIMREAGIVDLMITGHQHETKVGFEGRTAFIQAGQNAEKLIHVNVTFRKRRNTNELLAIEPEVVDLESYEESLSLLKITHYDRKAVRKWENEQIHPQPIDLSFPSFAALLQRRHPFIQLLSNAMKSAVTCDITCVHLPLPTSTGLSGSLRNKDIYHAYPHPDKPIDMTLTGADIKRLIEDSAAQLIIKDGHITLDETQDPTLYQFWSGFDYTIDISRPKYDRVVALSLREDYTYRIAMTDYCYRHYRQQLAHAVIHQKHSITIPELISEILRQDKAIDVETDNVTLLGE
ncbi:2', 3'-cyclic nucleotide 2'-phosphodiesterase [Staphylococcus microti]|uniref:2', 3'-cyclic nucleotide 2'-phosphodiesterase n=1 Tax=Staphylococcus microti TaxID=569857 RepID=A0A0D6XQ63_9STAP|nr:bifunctional UDP-sugar hydrolase/5'-nucleotidase [Staphylococcus microti]KIX90565.1 2', 3'-cyclic nucleotide 2'-phosphodiesterase [Staphylococcus microti]PNZ80616.1 bifunctional metallophosphatase/5'-nucleotidase [Staphylococcus microti]SUM57005.1 5' nucleotidase family protein [Staphylococcus microti]